MREDFLHFIWRFKKFDWLDLRTTAGDSIDIIDAGEYNTNAGPDFLNARIRIGETLWAGSVELHIKASEWMAHQHQHDAAYSNVILHVVWEMDKNITRNESSESLACVELKSRVQENLLGKYQQILHNAHWIPCQHHFFEVSALTKSMWYERLLVERLEQKTALFTDVLVQNKGNWEETFYQILARYFGGSINNDAFQALANSVSLLTLSKHKDNPKQIAALLFGQAGFLDADFEDEYPLSLKKEYQYLRQKHNLTPIPFVMWRYLRLRPANFPSIRIAQFATLIAQTVHLFSKTIETDTLAAWQKIFQLALPEYWETHYVFDKISKKSKKTLGKDSINLLLINTVAPCLFAYGKYKNDEDIMDKALKLLESIDAEKNNIISGWQNLGVDPENAAQTQALLQLKKHYCDKQACMNCAIGAAILK
jgi:hypothetical protein